MKCPYKQHKTCQFKNIADSKYKYKDINKIDFKIFGKGWFENSVKGWLICAGIEQLGSFLFMLSDSYILTMQYLTISNWPDDH